MTVKNNHLTDANVKLVDNANGYRLPTEAEWEYAARGGDPTAEDWNYIFSGATTKDQNYKSGDLESDSALDAVGWYSYNNDTGTTNTSYVINDAKRKGTHEAGKKAANRLGIYDMSGNVWEWCYDWDTNSVDATDVYYSYRGGCWYDIANFCTVSDQRYFTPDNRDFNLGFREVRSAK